MSKIYRIKIFWAINLYYLARLYGGQKNGNYLRLLELICI